jgi:hypothetical protein
MFTKVRKFDVKSTNPLHTWRSMANLRFVTHANLDSFYKKAAAWC